PRTSRARVRGGDSAPDRSRRGRNPPGDRSARRSGRRAATRRRASRAYSARDASRDHRLDPTPLGWRCDPDPEKTAKAPVYSKAAPENWIATRVLVDRTRTGSGSTIRVLVGRTRAFA